MTHDTDTRLIERLDRAAQQSSEISRQMSEAKSLRQDGNTERRTDLYMWSTPDQTLEGAAKARIESLRAEVARLREALEDLADQAEIAMRLEGGEGGWAVDAARTALGDHQ